MRNYSTFHSKWKKSVWFQEIRIIGLASLIHIITPLFQNVYIWLPAINYFAVLLTQTNPTPIFRIQFIYLRNQSIASDKKDIELIYRRYLLCSIKSCCENGSFVVDWPILFTLKLSVFSPFKTIVFFCKFLFKSFYQYPQPFTFFTV